ncbi:uncharacterized protein LOC106716932 isoform X2 [Papilio machaon]|uniref:uncharacterized protein LOC106716932 isoform X2 n=1 Tax=Papilio machaon TaxID=76193 RepID=UPI001E6637D3|nr:uncharacterized protein LOC106716932 isoform X2 [Papilio machaon]
MKVLYLVSAVILQCSWSYGSPNPDGVGVFAYQDSAGRRYECVYKPNVNEADDSSESSNVNKINEVLPFDTNWPDVIFGNIENQQRAAFEAAQNTFGAFNNFPFIPNFDFRYPPYGHFNYFGPSYRAPFDMPGSNSAFAAGAVGPGFRHQVAAINPGNPQMPNVDTTMNREPENRQGFYSVSSSSYASSLNNNGVPQNQRGAETVVNDNGRITKYVVHN